MKVTLLLADFAQVADGKLSILGGGWVFKGHGSPMALGVIVEVPWAQTDTPHNWTLRLVDADGRPALISNTLGEGQPLSVNGRIDIGRPPGPPHGTPFNVPLAINFGSLPLPPELRFTFVMEVDGEPAENGQVSFSTQPLPRSQDMSD